ncbi:FadR/GntR family transcriptional regulator [Pseudovibrio flavus]|uniref:FadR/GntR family transcriptional regulator n=1 Tax=Pseudovibrio flavus TaxID=2529854 RepID=UPI00211BCC87|nr:FadR/GntR family transcriptional regulator [Pseudovibrio flavus]
MYDEAREISQSAKQPMSAQVASRLQEYICRKQLSPGDSLPSESELGRLTGASRTVVREAMKLLEARRIVDLAPGKRACVASLDRFTMADFMMNGVGTRQITIGQIHDVRRTVEARIVHLAALMRTEEQADRLVDIAKGMCENFEDSEFLMTNDLAFHQELCTASRNPVYGVFMGAFNDVIRTTWPITWRCRKNESDRRSSVEIHLKIAEAIKAQDPDLAVKLMTKHFDDDLKPLAESGFN